MDANLNFLTAPPANTTQIAGFSGTSAVDPTLSKPMNGKEFAGLMRDLMPQSERQELAGLATADTLLQATNGLQTLSLGNQFAVITAASPLPDANSLAQFARTQGLSETAVQALFGDLNGSLETAKPIEIGKEGTGALTIDLSTPSLSNLGLSSFPANPLSLSMGSSINTSTSNTTLTMTESGSTASSSFPSLATLSWLQAHPGTEVISDKVEQSLWAKAPDLQAGLSVAAPIKDLALSSVISSIPANQVKVSDLNALLQTAGAAGVIQSVNGWGASPTNALDNVNPTTDLTEEMGPLDAMRMRMVPAWESMTRQLSKLNGSELAAAWGDIKANLFSSKARGDIGKEVVLDLGSENLELLSSLDVTKDDIGSTSILNLDSARNTASTGSLGAAATSAALANPGLTDRAAQIQDMADKLGKAMAERLQDQMERGEWKLQLKLNPAHLGKIDIELDMRSGGLEAVFKTDNLVTRELISQSMPKLRDSLSESGMTVANVWVNSENQKGSGGNSTPRQNSESDNTVKDSVSEVKVAESRIKELRSSDAWDTLA
jgi:flagellar hook-length control protein FliK